MIFKGEPNLLVSCTNNGKVVARVQFDENGLLETDNSFIIKKFLMAGYEAMSKRTAKEPEETEAKPVSKPKTTTNTTKKKTAQKRKKTVKNVKK